MTNIQGGKFQRIFSRRDFNYKILDNLCTVALESFGTLEVLKNSSPKLF